ncbi:DEAD/DEAH box helicase [Shewanella gaetbuli]|uniref:ATP-dependent RNA helicase RhlE n=1 Tax=Shewanella gaetbuli TaxID=220752 RepID=A0A9X1ZGF6_9GAMM|nr:DEAD/DEAH box helicase [Shewanella gaetbuli]MCL1141218.1 DEAD/DEAH box helicase [Shewanella gaetbuli]
MSFENLGLSAAILKAVAKQGYDTPSPIQAQAIPAVLQQKDVMAAAQTGTGKTAGFTLPILELLTHGKPAKRSQVRALVLTPTRELAAQVQDSVATYGSQLPLKSAVVFGGVSIQPQLAALKTGIDILVATPGRLLDLYQQRAISFDALEILVLDEADRMLDMGFIRDIKKILALLPEKRQNLMFSATFSTEIRELAKGLVNNPVEISVTPRNSTANSVDQSIYTIDKTRKSAGLIELIKRNNWHQVLVFSRTKHGANRLAKNLDAAGISAVAIHGNKSQTARTNALASFKQGKSQVMVATDIAARGIDIDQLPFVVNFDLPQVPEDYVHRIGRTGRAGATGQAVSLVSEEESKLLREIEKLIQRKITRNTLSGFEASFSLADTQFNAPSKPNSRANPRSKSRGNSGNNNQASKPRSKQQTQAGEKTNDRPPRRKKELVDLGPKFANRAQTNKDSTKDGVQSDKAQNRHKKPNTKKPAAPSQAKSEKFDPYAKAKQKFSNK